MMPIDTESLVPVQEEAAAVEGQQPTETVAHDIDMDSLTIDPPEKVQADAWTRAVSNSDKPGVWETIRNIILLPVAGTARIASDLGSVDYQIAPPTPIAEQRRQHIDFIAGATGVPATEIEKHYDNFRALADVTTHGIVSSIENASAAVPLPSSKTVEGIVNATMIPAITAAAVANPIGTAAGLLFFTGLDHIAPTPVIKGATPDQQATVNLIGMFVKGLATGGLMHRGARGIDPLDKMGTDWQLGDLYEMHLRDKLRANGMPDVITLAPEQVQAIRNIDAENKVQRKNDKRRQDAVNDVVGRIMNKKEIPNNVAVDIVRDAKQQIVDDINAKKGRGEKITNREQQLRYDIQKDLDSDPTGSIVSILGIDNLTSETAVDSGLSVKVPAEKLVKVAVDSEENFNKVSQVMSQTPRENRAISEEAYQKARQHFRESAGKLRSGIGAGDIKSLAVIGAYHFENGLVQFDAWSKKMLEENPGVEQHLKEIWEKVSKAKAVKLNASGQPVGAPPKGKEPSIDDLVRLAEKGVDGREWYAAGAKTAVEVGGENYDKFLKILAETSAQADPGVNLGYTIKAFYQDLLGKKISAGRYPNAMRENITKIFNGEHPSWGSKKQAFYESLKMEADKHLGNNYIEPALTVQDMWMARILGYKNENFSPTQYAYADRAIKNLASKMGLDYWKAQAQLWVGKQKEMDRVSKTYGEGAEDLAIQLHSEYITPKDEALPLQEKQILSEAIHKVLVDGNGNSRILKAVGVLGGKTVLEAGGWEGSARPSIRSIVYGNAMEIKGTISEKVVNQAAAAIGHVLGQDAVMISRAVKSGGKQAVLMDIGRPLNIKEADWMSKELAKKGLTAFAPDRAGMKVIDIFNKLKKGELSGILEEVAQRFSDEFGHDVVTVQKYQDHGQLLEGGKNGKGYSTELAKRPSVQKALDDLKLEVDKAREAYYAQKEVVPAEGKPSEASPEGTGVSAILPSSGLVRGVDFSYQPIDGPKGESLFADMRESRSAEFKKWFGKSVVQENGVPEVRYFGSEKPVSKLENKVTWLNDGAGDSAGEGFDTMPHQKAFFVKLNKPYNALTRAEIVDKPYNKKWIDKLKSQGYDGIVSSDYPFTVVFDPATQLREAPLKSYEYFRKIGIAKEIDNSRPIKSLNKSSIDPNYKVIESGGITVLREIKKENRFLSVDEYQNALKNWKDKTTGLKSGIDPTAAADLAIIGGYHLESGIRSFPEWSKKMTEDVGKLSEETLKKVWDDLHIAPQAPQLGEQRRSGLAASVEEKAVEKKLTKGFEGTSEYDAIDIKDQAAKATELVTRSPLIAYRVAMGLENAPGDLRAHSVYVALEKKALANGDVNTLRDLATMSSLNQESSGAAQTLRILAERDPSSPVSAIKDLTKTREEVAKKRVKNIEKAKADIASEIKREIRKPKQTKQSWAAFAESLRC